MPEITMKIEMDLITKDISINNINFKKSFLIPFSSKELKANDVYDVISFSKGNIYTVVSNIDKVIDESDKDYLGEIVNIFTNICKEINKIQ